MKEISIHVGQRIRLYRKMKGLTIETFAGMIQKSKATVSKYENGDISIDIETLFTIAQALEISEKESNTKKPCFCVRHNAGTAEFVAK